MLFVETALESFESFENYVIFHHKSHTRAHTLYISFLCLYI